MKLSNKQKARLIKQAINESYYSPPLWHFYGAIRKIKKTEGCITYRVMIESDNFPGLLYLYEVELFDWADSAFAWFQGTYKSFDR